MTGLRGCFVTSLFSVAINSCSILLVAGQFISYWGNVSMLCYFDSADFGIGCNVM